MSTTLQKTKHVVPTADGKFLVNKPAIIKTLVRAARNREKLEKKDPNVDDAGTLPLSTHEVLEEGKSLQRYTADSMLNIVEE